MNVFLLYLDLLGLVKFTSKDCIKQGGVTYFSFCGELYYCK